MGLSGADAEYARQLKAAGLVVGTGHDSARLEQLIDEREIDGVYPISENSSVGDPLPSYVTGTHDNHFDSARNVYNYKPSNTRKLRRGLSRAATGGFGEIVVIGDSSVVGAIDGPGLVWDRLRAWPMQMRDELARHGIPTCGTGMVRTLDKSWSDARYTFGGTWNSGNENTIFTVVNNSTCTFTTNLAGNRVTVHYFDGADNTTWTISVNGSLAGDGFQSITNSGPLGYKKVEMSLVTPVAIGQTVQVKMTSAGVMTPVTITVWNSTGGLLVNNIGQGGSKAGGVSAKDNWSDASAVSRLGVVYASPTVTLSNPDAVICFLGGNDIKTFGSTDAEIHTALTTIRNRYPNSDFILGASFQISTIYFTTARWEQYVSSLYDLADTLDVPLIDYRSRIGNYATVVANGLNGDSDGHLKVECFHDQGRNTGLILAQ